MSYDFKIEAADKATLYRDIAGALEGLVAGEPDAIANMIGAEVTELIQGYTIGKTAELVETDFIQTVFPHPTLSEMMHESVLAAFGRVIHI